MLCCNHGVNFTRFFPWTVSLFSTWKLCSAGFCQLPIRAVDFLISLSAGRLDHDAPSQAAPLHCLLQSVQMCSAVPRMHGMARPVLSRGCGQTLLPTAAECHCFPRHIVPPASADTHRRTPGIPCSCMLRQMLKGVFSELLAIFV